jgi:hypothetical protein
MATPQDDHQTMPVSLRLQLAIGLMCQVPPESWAVLAKKSFVEPEQRQRSIRQKPEQLGLRLLESLVYCWPLLLGLG